MSVYIEENAEGQLALHLGEEPDVLGKSPFADRILAFRTVHSTPTLVVLDVGDEVASPLEFLTSALESSGLRVRLSENLQRMISEQRLEREQIEMARAVPTKDELAATIELPAEIPGFQNPDVANLLPHQARGLRLALALGNLAEYSVQGSGKTAIALAAFSIWKARGEVDKIVVVGPVSSHKPWEDEIHRCIGQNASILRWSGSVSQRTRLVPLFNSSAFVLCTYDTAVRDQQMLGRLLRSFKTLLVLDEAHYIKNFAGGARVAMASKLASSSTKRMVLTGTPTPHSLFDLWNQLKFLWPSATDRLIGNRVAYQDLLNQTSQPAKHLRERVGMFYHRTRQDELNLPTPLTHFVDIDADQIPEEQSKIVKLLEIRVMSEARAILTKTSDRELLGQWRKARIIRLLQVASNPGLLAAKRDDWWSTEVGDVEMSDLLPDIRRFHDGELLSAKIRWTAEKARSLVRKGEKVLIWTWWVENIRLLDRLLSDLKPLLLFGEIKPYQEDWDDPHEVSRERNISDFRANVDRPILIANPSACAESISLHRECHNAIYVDRTYNCGQFLQSLNRIHRVGLPEGVITNYWIPILDCAIERSVDTRLRERQQTMYDFLDDNAPVFSFIAEEESSVAEDDTELEKDFASLAAEVAKRGDDKTDK